MPRTRNLEIWHIPKRQNVHQIIGAVEILSQDKFNGKSWTGMRQENFNTQLGRQGFTNTGRPLSPSARRTLEALIKYLGFIYVDNTTTPPTMNVTNAGYELIKKHGSVLGKRRTFRLVQTNKEEILESPVVEYQMSKLQITNPIIRGDCINILLFPFRITLRLLMDLDKLTKEELAYIVFSMKKEDEYNLILERIKTFRSLSDERRKTEIEAFKNTEIGNLTLVQAPTATYYMGLCVGTGLCERKGNDLFIREEKLGEAKKILNKFKDVKPFDFADNLRLWIDYFGNTKRLQPPLLVSVTLKNIAHIYLRILGAGERELEHGVISEENPIVSFPLFKKEEYKFEFYSFIDAKKICEKIVDVQHDKITFDILVKKEVTSSWDFNSIVNRITELIDSRDFDSEYLQHINIVKIITGRDNFSLPQLRGGRLEYLFYKLLLTLKDKGIIDDVVWNGRINEFGLAYPALGGKEGYPDIYFFVGKKLFVLELTTIRANALQWSAEGASVHDHIINLLGKVKAGYQVIGLFSAPTIYPRVKDMFKHITTKEKIPHNTISIEDLIELFKKGRNAINKLSK